MYRKYKPENITIPQNERMEINEKINYIVTTGDHQGITHNDIFNGYTGLGGLHGLSFEDFDNYHRYSEAKKEYEQGQFFTPNELCEFLYRTIKPLEHDFIGDLTCGMGNFFNYHQFEENIYGNELDTSAYNVAKYLYPEANLSNEDIRFYDPNVKLSVIFGNPPFNLKWDYERQYQLSQFIYCIKSYDLLRVGGLLAIIVPQSFMLDDFHDSKIISRMNSMFTLLFQFKLEDEAFIRSSVKCFQTKVMVFVKNSETIDWKNTFICEREEHVNILSSSEADRLYFKYIEPIQKEKEKWRAKLLREASNNNNASDSFESRIKKYLFDIKRNPLISMHYGNCLQYIDQFFHQKKPDGMKILTWEETRIKEGDVISHLNKVLKLQNHVEKDEIRLVKSNYGLKLKAYSQAMSEKLKSMGGSRHQTFNDMLLNGIYPYEDQTYRSLLERKRKAWENQRQDFKKMVKNKSAEAFVNGMTFFDKKKNKTIYPNDIQINDISLVLSKRYGTINWEQGGGKSLAGAIWLKYLITHNLVNNVFVVSPAISINMTWDDILDNYDIPYIKITGRNDIARIKRGQVVIISVDMLIKLERSIKKFIRLHSQKIGLIFDESDALTNAMTKTTKATLNCFRRVRYKLLTTGTTTRNNINELYSQLELLYNNSINMICDCEFIYKVGKAEQDNEFDDGLNDGIMKDELREMLNPHYMKPFPAYRGRKLFKACYSPSKTTVFGVRKMTQDLYNMESLSEIIRYTIITRKFHEIVGKKMHRIQNHAIPQNQHEADLYKIIIERFYEMMYRFRHTGNDRKESMLKIIRQIQLLIYSCSVPHLFKEYQDKNVLPNKYLEILSLLKQWPNERVAIGTTSINAVNNYATFLKENLPDRPLYIVLGDVPFKKRRVIVEEFQNSKNGILLSTQQSLSMSVNIPKCKKVIVESLQWNMPALTQYIFRFIRFDSEELVNVHTITYEYSIEQNIMGLIMAKERLNDFIKTLELRDREEIFEENNIDLSILDMVMEQVMDDEGNLKISWGKQKIS